MLSFNALSEKDQDQTESKLQDVQECPDEMDMPKKKFANPVWVVDRKVEWNALNASAKDSLWKWRRDTKNSKGGEVEPPRRD